MSAITATIVDEWYDGKRHFVIGNLTFTGNYTTAVGGMTLDFALAGVQCSVAPTYFSAPLFEGYEFDYIPATDGLPNDGKLAVYTANATELGTGAFPAALLNNKPQFLAIFPQLI